MVMGIMTIAMMAKVLMTEKTMMMQMIGRPTPVVKIMVVPWLLMTMVMAIMGTQM